jgi:hypothetical protein
VVQSMNDLPNSIDKKQRELSAAIKAWTKHGDWPRSIASSGHYAMSALLTFTCSNFTSGGRQSTPCLFVQMEGDWLGLAGI